MDRPRILAVDDEPRGVELVKRILRRSADVETATSGEEALERLEGADFSLVISDQRMPGISGVDLLARVVGSQPFCGRILITGYAENVDTVEAINRARVHAYLNKPCPPNQLSLTVESVLEQVEMQKENARLAEMLRMREGTRTPAESLAHEIAQCADRVRCEAEALSASLDTRAEGCVATSSRIAALGGRLAELSEDLLSSLGKPSDGEV